MKILSIVAAVVLCGTGTFIYQLRGQSAPRNERPRRAAKTATASAKEDEESEAKAAERQVADRGSPRAEGEAASEELPKDHHGRTTIQPGSVIPDKYVEIYAKVSGYLDYLGTDVDGKPIDIGSRVAKGKVLAKIFMPELEKEVERDKAALERAKAVVEQMKARITTAEADFKAATSMVDFRTKVFNRLDELADKDVMDRRVVDEKEEQMHAAEETKNAAAAKILQANADLAEAEAEVDLAQATLDRAQVDLDYATIKSPYDGVITVRNFWPGDFIKERDGGTSVPLLIVQKTDVVRVVVQIPDADAPYVHPGNEATVTVKNLPGMKFEGVVSRIAGAEDPLNRTMRVEVDLKNNRSPKLRDGMYASVTIKLDDGLESGTQE